MGRAWSEAGWRKDIERLIDSIYAATDERQRQAFIAKLMVLEGRRNPAPRPRER